MPQISLHTPVGPLSVSAEGDAIVALDWGWGRDQEETPLLRAAADWLQDYFDGTWRPMTLALDPYGTAYRKGVWKALLAVGPGESLTYRQLAAIAGGSARSVGTAMATNPIPILIPCHRVLGSLGAKRSIGGYSGGEGLPTKRQLLAHEGITLAAPSAFAVFAPQLPFA